MIGMKIKATIDMTRSVYSLEAAFSIVRLHSGLRLETIKRGYNPINSEMVENMMEIPVRMKPHPLRFCCMK
jgi:hypothetical protein